jgi:broad specificity phosphatase PhoE
VAILYLVRHCQSESNAAGHWRGTGNSPLTALGREQAAKVAAMIAAWPLEAPRLACSPMRRAVDTAAAIGAALKIAPFIDERLGAGEGREGQSLEEAGAEVEAAIEALRSPAPLIVVTHRFPLRGYLARLIGDPDAETLVTAVGNGDVLEIKLDHATRTATHHRLA